jgi:hypothetical protein
MRDRIRRTFSVFAIVVTASPLAGCATINGWLAGALADYTPQFLGGLPANAPPRPGDPKYPLYLEELEGRRARPAVAKTEEPAAPKSEPSLRQVY